MKTHLLLLCFLLIFGLTTANSQTHNLIFHSDLEKEAILNFSENKNADNLFLVMMASTPSAGQQQVSEAREITLPIIEKYKKGLKNDLMSSAQVSQMFYKVHRKILKRYQPYTPVASMMKSGHYDCLSATALYAYILSALGQKYEIMETTYHIYLKVNTQQGWVLLESTDPLNGFISEKSIIEKQIALYNKEQLLNEQFHQFSQHINDAVANESLVGLLYYNLAVDSYNNHDLVSSINLFEKASLFHNTARLQEFGSVIKQQLLADSNINETTQYNLLLRLNKVLDNPPTLAVR